MKSSTERTIHRSRALRFAATAVAAVGLSTGVATVAGAATASTAPSVVHPLAANGCGGNACIYLSNAENGYVYVDAWAHNATFFGHFDLTRSGTVITTSGNRTFSAGGNDYQFNNVAAVVAQYCVVGWTSTGVFEGRACESVE